MTTLQTLSSAVKVATDAATTATGQANIATLARKAVEKSATDVAANAGAVAAAAAVAININNRIYPGLYNADPLTRPDGSAIVDGDVCSLVSGVMRVHIAGAWQDWTTASGAAAAAAATAAGNSSTLAGNWAAKTAGGDVDGAGNYSSKEYAQGTQAGTGGSSKNWAAQTGAEVTGAPAGSQSAKAWAVEDLTATGRNKGGSAKDWATSAALPDGVNKSAKSYATDAGTQAAASLVSAGQSAASAAGAAGSATGIATTATSVAALAGITAMYPTAAAMNADGTIAANAKVLVLSDEGKQGQTSLYQKVAGVMTYLGAVNYTAGNTTGWGDWTFEGAVQIWCGDSTFEQMQAAGSGFDYITGTWRAKGMPASQLLGVVNFGGSGYRLRDFVTGAATGGFVGPTGALPGVSAGINSWDFWGHKPVGAISLATALAWRAGLPSNVRRVQWFIGHGINDLILYNDVGGGTVQQIADYITSYLVQAAQTINRQFPKDLVGLVMPASMSSRPFNSGAGFPSTAAWPTFGADGPTDAALVNNWNQGLALGYLQAQNVMPRSVMFDTRDYFGYSTATLTAIPAGNQTAGAAINGNPRLADLVHPSGSGQAARVAMVFDKLLSLRETRVSQNLFRAMADTIVSQGYTGNAWDIDPYYFKDNVKYREIGTFIVNAVGSNFIDLNVAQQDFIEQVLSAGATRIYAMCGNTRREAISWLVQDMTTFNPSLQTPTVTRLLVTVPVGARLPSGTITFYTPNANEVVISGNTYLSQLLRKRSSTRHAIVGTVPNGSAGNGFIRVQFDALQPSGYRPSSKYFQINQATSIAVGGALNTTQSLAGASVSAFGGVAARTVQINLAGVDFTAWAGQQVAILYDDTVPDPLLDEFQLASYAAGLPVVNTPVFFTTRTKMAAGLASITLSTTAVVTTLTVNIYRHTANARNLIATMTISAGLTKTAVSGTDFTAIASVAEGETWEIMPTAVNVPANYAMMLKLTPNP